MCLISNIMGWITTVHLSFLNMKTKILNLEILLTIVLSLLLSLLLYECLDFHRKSRINSRLMILLNVILSMFHAVMGVIEMKSNVSCYTVL